MSRKTPQRPIEHKTFSGFLVKAGGEAGEGVVEAIVSVLGVIDDGRPPDIIESGAFVKTIVEHGRRVKVLDSHNSWSLKDVVGKPLELREIDRAELERIAPDVLVKYPSATGALLTKTQYLMNTPEGDGAFKRIQADAVNEYSIGYEVIRSESRKVKAGDGAEVAVRVIKEIKLWEYSPVLWGMNPATATISAKDAKEMTAQGPVIRMGDYLCGVMRYVVQSRANEMLMFGKLGQADISQINAALEAAMTAFNAALPEVLAQSQVARSSYYYDELDADREVKGLDGLDLDTKAGRVLSERNVARIQTAYDALGEVLTSAGVINQTDEDDADEDDSDSKSGTPPAKAGPGAEDQPATPPTDEARKHLPDATGEEDTEEKGSSGDPSPQAGAETPASGTPSDVKALLKTLEAELSELETTP